MKNTRSPLAVRRKLHYVVLFSFLLVFCLLLPPSSFSSASASKRYVIIRFDDGYQDAWVNARPVLASYGFKASYLIITDAATNNGISNAIPGTFSYMSWQEIKSLYSHGNEIVDHSATHPDMDYLSSSQLNSEVVGSRQTLLNHGISNVPDFALPYGDSVYNSTVINYIYSNGFIHAWGAYEGQCGICNYNTLGSVWIPIDWVNNDTSVGALKSYLSEASSSFVVGLEFHQVEAKASNVNSSNPYGISLADFKADMAYLHNKGFTVVLATSLPHYKSVSGPDLISISSSPLTIQPAQTLQTSITVKNGEPSSVVLESLTNFLSSGSPSLTAWMTSSSELPSTLAAGSTYVVEITVQTSSSASAGTYYLTGQINCNNGQAPLFSITVYVN
jgi:peptidoglycan/xylan/chitin deacetylase (PgdA/CDA1 family)